MTVYLNPEVRSGLGEDTVWEWWSRDLPGSTFDYPPTGELAPGDRFLHYATLGEIDLPLRGGGERVALCWELYHEMRLQLDSTRWNTRIHHMERAALACERRVVSTKLAAPFFEPFGEVDVLPIGVDTDLFEPKVSRKEARSTHDIPSRGGKVLFWCGTDHPMKGFDRVLAHAEKNPEDFIIVVWKSAKEQAKNITRFHGRMFCHVTQEHLAGLMNCCDGFLVTGRLRPFFLVEWEAMAADLPAINISGLSKDFVPSRSPREDVFRLGWDRKSALATWKRYLGLA